MIGSAQLTLFLSKPLANLAYLSPISQPYIIEISHLNLENPENSPHHIVNFGLIDFQPRAADDARVGCVIVV